MQRRSRPSRHVPAQVATCLAGLAITLGAGGLAVRAAPAGAAVAAASAAAAPARAGAARALSATCPVAAARRGSC